MLSVVLATFNEEKNLLECLESVKDIAGEIVIVDGSSSDKTVEVAKSFGARVHVTDNPPIFHINKQKALEMAKGDWILQLDADERVSPELANEIRLLIGMKKDEIEKYEDEIPHKKLFVRHQTLIEQRDGKIGNKEGEYTAFFIPRLNYFLGKYLRYGGVYPDGVIRLVKKDTAHFPSKDVHEQIVITGRVGWLENPLLHKDSPTFERYINRNNRYIGLLAGDYKKNHLGKDPLTMIRYIIAMPIWWFLLTFFRHKGFLDGWQGFVFSIFSARRFAKAYIQYAFTL